MEHAQHTHDAHEQHAHHEEQLKPSEMDHSQHDHSEHESHVGHGVDHTGHELMVRNRFQSIVLKDSA